MPLKLLINNLPSPRMKPFVGFLQQALKLNNKTLKQQQQKAKDNE